jgi:ribosomal protein L40E
LALCRRCRARLADATWASGTVRRWWSLESHRREGRICARCGAAPIPEDSVDAMLSKLAQLSRFGLGADDRPLLVHYDGEWD